MAIHGAFTHCGIFVNGLDLTGVSNMVKITAAKEVRDRTTFGNAAKVRAMAGLEEIQLAAAGFLGMEAGGRDEAFRANLYSDRIDATVMIPSVSGAAPSAGDTCWFFRGSQAQYGTGDAQGNDLLWSLNLQGGAGGFPLCFGKVLDPGTTPVTGDGSGPGVQAGPVPDGRYAYALLHVLEVGEGGSILVTIESAAASDFAGAATRFTFSPAGATGSEFLARIPGPVTDGWWRCAYEVTGSEPRIRTAVAIAIQ